MSESSPDVTVIVPVVERPTSLTALYREFAAPLRQSGRSFEFVFVSYPWFRHLTDPLGEFAAQGEPIRLIEAMQGVSETALLKLAAASARGAVLVTLPAYFQTEASAIPALLARVEAGADLAVAWRWPRRDSLVNRLQNRVLHLFVGGITGGRLHDVACGVRALRREVVQEVPLYGEFARFLPLLAMREGFAVEEVQSPVHPGAMRSRVYGPGVYLRRLIDVVGLLFLLKFTDKPLRFFGLIGSVLSGIGAIMLAVLFFQRLAGESLASRPMLLLAVLLMVLGIQSVALGLIGEMIVHLTA
ncbi:MAG TPA: hypothetical protein VEU27_09505, partial [Gemmatimonadales bacterium]|nr:hypothetical protein [Gemmatimonadales bacterium]